jgi:hypothetical protein
MWNILLLFFPSVFIASNLCHIQSLHKIVFEKKSNTKLQTEIAKVIHNCKIGNLAKSKTTVENVQKPKNFNTFAPKA